MTARQVFELSPITQQYRGAKIRSLPQIAEETIIDKVSDYYNISYKVMASRSRKREIVTARQVAMYLMRKRTNLSLKAIADMFGGRDHTTVIHSCQTVKDLIYSDPVFMQDVNILNSALL